MEYKKNDCVTVTIEDMGSEGEGIGKADGFALFVKDAVVGDTVEAKILKCKKNYAYARLEKVITPSPFRVEPKCAYYRQCGGCQLQALSYEKQLEFKQKKIRNHLIRIGGFSPEYIDERMEPIVGMEEPLHYRNKAQYPVGTDREGNVITGFYAGRTHSIIANTECHLGASENQEILEIILNYMRQYKVSAYDETTGKGLVRHVLIRKGFTSGEIMVCLVINKKMTNPSYMAAGGKNSGSGAEKELSQMLTKENREIPAEFSTKFLQDKYNEDPKQNKLNHGGKMEFVPKQDRLLERLAAVKGMTSVSVSINTERTNVIMGKEFYTLWGSPVISDTIHVRDMQREGYPLTGKELNFHISPLSFYQVNPVQTEKLYSLALEYAGLTGQETVWDLYCGIGTITLFLAGSAKKVYGVEMIPQAIQDARENAKRNGIENAEFFVGKAEEVLPEFYERKSKQKHSDMANVCKKSVEHFEENRDIKFENFDSDGDMLHPDVIVVDPPRKGCDEACLNTMLKMQPERIVYVSCDSATLARDLRVLCDEGYELEKIRGVDQFGMTVHVETVVLLSQRKPDDTIEVDLDLDELDITAAEKKATYREIQEYVLKKYNLKVSNLYISQVKRKCGLEVGENYNLSKKENQKIPQCPQDKEAAIRDALNYFAMTRTLPE